LAALRRKEEKLAREKSDTSPSQSSQVKPQQLQKLQQHLRSPARGSSQQSQSSPSTSPSATSPVKDYVPIPMNRPELTWVPKTPPEEKPSSAMKNTKITNYFVFEKDPPVKSPHFANTNVPPKPQDLGNVARKINFDAKTSPAKTPSITLSKHDSNLSNGKYEANTQTDESQNMEEDNAFDLSLLCEPSQPPTQPLTNSTPRTQLINKPSQTQTPVRAAAPSAAPKKASPAPKKASTPSKPTTPAVPSSAVRKDASLLHKFYHSESADTQTDESAMQIDSTDDRPQSLRGSNGLNNNNTRSSAASASSMEEEDSVKKAEKLQTKNKLQSLSYSKSNDDEEPDEETPNLKKSALLKEDEVSHFIYSTSRLSRDFRSKKVIGGETHETKKERKLVIPATIQRHFISHLMSSISSLKLRNNIGPSRKIDSTRLFSSNKETSITCSAPMQVSQHFSNDPPGHCSN
jgi:hypothetical protein